MDREAATEKGIYVTWTPGTTTISVAEHALTLILFHDEKDTAGYGGSKGWYGGGTEMAKNVELTV